MWIVFLEYKCKGKCHREEDWSCSQPVNRMWEAHAVRSFMTD
jgi:hypothetical protein